MFNNIFNSGSEKSSSGYSHANRSHHRSRDGPYDPYDPSPRALPPQPASRYGSSAGHAHGGAVPSSLRHVGDGGSRSYPSHPRQNLSTSGGIPLRVTKCEENAYQHGNLVAVSPVDIPPSRDGTDLYMIVDDLYVFSARPMPGFEQGTIGLNSLQRMWAQLSLGKPVIVKPFNIFADGAGDKYLASLDIEIAFIGSHRTSTAFSQEELKDSLIMNFANQVIAPRQLILMEYKGLFFRLTITSVQLGNLSLPNKETASSSTSASPTVRGILTKFTDVTFFKDRDSSVNIKASDKRPPANAVMRPDFKFESMGIGGLDEEFSTVFRRSFASRVFPLGLVEKLDIPHVKGMLLYGPPGTGKTLIARQIGKMLNARPPKVVNGPEILDKFVGQSEQNVRNLFLDAEREYKAKGEESGLHIIIFDEIDAICKQRGSTGGGTGTSDNVVNQILSKLDGVDQLNNILIIGMTNRLDLIDEALLRPGRLEVHLEIPLPDEDGRLQILKIQTQKMRENKMLAPDVEFPEVAKLTKNFTGAEIGGLVKSAVSFAFTRHIKVGTVAGISEDAANIKITRGDFEKALGEIRPAYGADESSLQSRVDGGIVRFSRFFDQILELGSVPVRLLSDPEESRSLYSLLLYGKPGSGKTALAAQIALDSQLAYIKVISQEDMMGYNEMGKVNYMHRIMTDAYKSQISLIILDNIEHIIDWSSVGPRFSLTVLQAVVVILTKRPPSGHRLFIIATSSKPSVLERLELLDNFSKQVPVPYIQTHEELRLALSQIGAFSTEDVDRILRGLRHETGSDRLNIGIKKVLQYVEEARHSRQFGDAADAFVHLALQKMDLGDPSDNLHTFRLPDLPSF